jgi:hypothetical protein
MEKINLKDLSIADLISVNNYLRWCENNMEDTVDDYDEKKIYRDDFSIKKDAVIMEINYKIGKMNFKK